MTLSKQIMVLHGKQGLTTTACQGQNDGSSDLYKWYEWSSPGPACLPARIADATISTEATMNRSRFPIVRGTKWPHARDSRGPYDCGLCKGGLKGSQWAMLENADNSSPLAQSETCTRQSSSTSFLPPLWSVSKYHSRSAGQDSGVPNRTGSDPVLWNHHLPALTKTELLQNWGPDSQVFPIAL